MSDHLDEIKALEARRPPAGVNPQEHARVNEQISRMIDENRALKAATGFKVV